MKYNWLFSWLFPTAQIQLVKHNLDPVLVFPQRNKGTKRTILSLLSQHGFHSDAIQTNFSVFIEVKSNLKIEKNFNSISSRIKL